MLCTAAFAWGCLAVTSYIAGDFPFLTPAVFAANLLAGKNKWNDDFVPPGTLSHIGNQERGVWLEEPSSWPQIVDLY